MGREMLMPYGVCQTWFGMRRGWQGKVLKCFSSGSICGPPCSNNSLEAKPHLQRQRSFSVIS